ncbi:hypothetical protein [Streptomyces sp. MUM 178J]|uniref:hypothetical protein n=1 Tax=Streptomyces sp. MUM 178J TaxID=2791991 RepID=UPI001F042380|nr:hypothetical protein [Streptomyces sp. MUM 178J]WRQ83333.1 hypothetical protein I3F59_010395 [Streptomyces sp. MUM 178J]
MLGGAGILLAASPAEAAEISYKAEVSYKTKCVPPPISGLPPVQGDTTVEITAPAEAEVGDEVEIVWKTVEAASRNPDVLDLGKDTVKPTGVITLGGAASGELAVEGPRQNPPIPKNSPMVLSDMKGTLKLEKAGEVTLTPGAYTINVSKPISTDTKCTPQEEVRAAAAIKVTEGGGASGGTASGGTSASGGSASGGGTSSGGTTASGGGTSSGGTTASGGGTSSGGTTASGGGTSSGGTTASGGSTSSGGSASGGSTSSGGTSASGGAASGGGNGGQTDFPGTQVNVVYDCKPPGPQGIRTPITVNAEKNGGGYDLTVKTGEKVMDSPAALPAGALKGSMAVVLGGADEGTVTVTGQPNKDPIDKDKPVSIGDLKGVYKPGATGTATLSPGTLTIDVNLGGQTLAIPCTVKGSAGVSLKLTTEAQPGGASGGTTTGGSSGGAASGGAATGGAATGGATATGGTSSSGGGLAETGAENAGALRALALAAGTVVLLGGAVLTFTPWRRLRGEQS